MSAVGRELIRPNMSAGGGSCLSPLIAAPTFPRTVPRTSTLQRQGRTSVVDSGLVDSSSPANYQQSQPSQTFIDGSSRSQPAVAISRQAHQSAVANDRSVLATDSHIYYLLH